MRFTRVTVNEIAPISSRAEGVRSMFSVNAFRKWQSLARRKMDQTPDFAVLLGFAIRHRSVTPDRSRNGIRGTISHALARYSPAPRHGLEQPWNRLAAGDQPQDVVGKAGLQANFADIQQRMHDR